MCLIPASTSADIVVLRCAAASFRRRTTVSSILSVVFIWQTIRGVWLGVNEVNANKENNCESRIGRHCKHPWPSVAASAFRAVGCEFLFKPPSVAEMTRGSMTSSGSHPDELPAGVRCQLLEQALVP